MSRIKCCRLCPRMCGAERTDNAPSAGVCAMPSAAYVSKAMLHMWEEPPISGTRGAGTIFFSGCTLGCVYCQNYEISRGKCAIAGKPVTAAGLAEIMERLEAQGAHNIELVTATQFVPQVIAALKLRPATVPVVWNSSGYEREAVIDALAPYVDIWLPDYKYALPKPAERFSGAADYPETALRALLRMRAHQPEDVFDGDIMQKGMIVRHLVLPLNVRNSIEVLRNMAEHLPGTLVSLMGQYTPIPGLEAYPGLQRPITPHEYERVCDAAAELGIEGFAQELESSDCHYIPHWDI
ncbi:MAG: 4Fe-4S cluster-binding domain-containing protein [Ruminococcaceae bacterium]|nr:4Fe-4S cluster-binding domain-containing protein [Oscillospiraceae bacterium]